MAVEQYVRGSMTPGSNWYPASAPELRRQLDSFFSKVVKGSGDVAALIVPHAGYAYSGQVAAYAFKQVEKGDYKTVVILAPSHQYPFEDVAVAVSDRVHYQTPLGGVPVSALARALQSESSLIKDMPKEHPHEHAAEILVPLLQRTLSDFEVVPIIFGKLNLSQVDELASLLIKHVDERTLIVASTDLSHYHPYDEAVAVDKRCVEAISAGDFKKVSRFEMCGYYPVITLMRIAQKLGWRAKLLKYMNSGDVSGDRSAVIGFASLAFYR